MKKYSKDYQQLMATWAADCAERVLPLFENAYPADDRPRKAMQKRTMQIVMLHVLQARQWLWHMFLNTPSVVYIMR